LYYKSGARPAPRARRHSHHHPPSQQNSTPTPPTVALLEPLRAALKEAAGAELVLHPRAKGDDGATAIDALLSAARASSETPILGATLKDAHEGALAALWQQKLQQAEADEPSPSLKVVSAAEGVASLLALKDDAEAVCVRKAGLLAARVLQDYLLNKMETAIDEGKRVRHAKLSGKASQSYARGHGAVFVSCRLGRGTASRPPPKPKQQPKQNSPTQPSPTRPRPAPASSPRTSTSPTRA
jgi:Xaa-Pro aminopeptidase